MTTAAVARCMDCRVPLSLDEIQYYENLCEVCEGESMERLDATLPRLRAIERARRIDLAAQIATSITGLLGAAMLASATAVAPWGWLAFLASNIAGIAFALRRRLWWILLQQVGFTGTSVLGVWRWLL